MKQRKTTFKHQLIILVCLLGILAWFGAPAVAGQDHDAVMGGSGFKKWNVDTDQEKAFFDNHPEDKFITYKKADNVVHVYKDPETGVIYAGNGDALQAYVKAAKAQGMTAKAQEDAAEQSDPDFWQNWEDEYGP
ncbi:MAG: hypothetical protein ACOC6L_04395 [Thermodesulfobacteriota bacterium]